MKKTIKFDVQLEIQLRKDEETGQIIVYCPALDLSTCGNTPEHAVAMFKEAFAIFLQDLAERGTTKEVLTELGWHKGRSSWVPPELLSKRKVHLQVPISA